MGEGRRPGLRVPSLLNSSLQLAGPRQQILLMHVQSQCSRPWLEKDGVKVARMTCWPRYGQRPCLLMLQVLQHFSTLLLSLPQVLVQESQGTENEKVLYSSLLIETLTCPINSLQLTKFKGSGNP